MALTEEKLAQFLKERRKLDGVHAEMPLFSDGTIDSVGMIDLITFVEKEAGIEVGQADVTLENFDTIARIIAYAQSKAG